MTTISDWRQTGPGLERTKNPLLFAFLGLVGLGQDVLLRAVPDLLSA